MGIRSTIAGRIDKPQRPARRMPSPWRILAAALLVVAVGGGVAFAVRGVTTTPRTPATADAARRGTWFAPYLDATMPPVQAFQRRSVNPARHVVLGFVVAKRPRRDCTPSWDGYTTPDRAEATIELDRRVARLRALGGDVVVSFGGYGNTELAVACKSTAALKAAYRAVIERYALRTVDLDIEGPALHHVAANRRRAAAVRAIQLKRRIAVWLTLPVTPEGMRPAALAVVRTMLHAKVQLAGVNVMAMNFGVPHAARDMRAAMLSSITATRGQLAALYSRAGMKLDGARLWRKVGVTVMIGQNDIATERVAVRDAAAVMRFAASHGLGRVSLWSLNRDARCRGARAGIGRHSDHCSGVAQGPRQFTRTLHRLRRG